MVCVIFFTTLGARVHADGLVDIKDPVEGGFVWPFENPEHFQLQVLIHNFTLSESPNQVADVLIDNIQVDILYPTEGLIRHDFYPQVPDPVYGSHRLVVRLTDDMTDEVLDEQSVNFRVVKPVFDKESALELSGHPDVTVLDLPTPLELPPPGSTVVPDKVTCDMLAESWRRGYAELGRLCPQNRTAPKPDEGAYCNLTDYMYLLEIQNAYVEHNGDVYTNDFSIISEGCAFCARDGIQTTCVRPPYTSRERPVFAVTDPVPEYDTIFAISQGHGGGVWHMMGECFPRLFALESVAFDPNVMIHIVIPNPVTLRILEFAGIGEDRIIHETAFGRRVFVSRSTPCDVPVPDLALRTRNFIWQRLTDAHGCVLPRVDVVHNQPRRIVVIKRYIHAHRNFINHDELLEALRGVPGVGAVDVYSDRDGLSFAEILCMFSNADLVIGPHGAGLMNIFALRSGLSVLEVIPHEVSVPGGLSMCYRNLAGTLGLHYYAMAPIESRGGPMEGDMVLDIHRVVEWTKDQIAQLQPPTHTEL